MQTIPALTSIWYGQNQQGIIKTEQRDAWKM